MQEAANRDVDKVDMCAAVVLGAELDMVLKFRVLRPVFVDAVTVPNDREGNEWTAKRSEGGRGVEQKRV